MILIPSRKFLFLKLLFVSTNVSSVSASNTVVTSGLVLLINPRLWCTSWKNISIGLLVLLSLHLMSSSFRFEVRFIGITPEDALSILLCCIIFLSLFLYSRILFQYDFSSLNGFKSGFLSNFPLLISFFFFLFLKLHSFLWLIRLIWSEAYDSIDE